MAAIKSPTLEPKLIVRQICADCILKCDRIERRHSSKDDEISFFSTSMRLNMRLHEHSFGLHACMTCMEGCEWLTDVGPNIRNLPESEPPSFRFTARQAT